MSEDVEKIYKEFTEKGYTDGLPIIPPTESRVKKMLEYTDRKPDDSLGRVPPSDYEATIEAIAVNAVMAGCEPEYFPVVVTEIDAMLDKPNLRGAIGTAGGPVWPMGFANGPIAKEIGMYCDRGLLGSGPKQRANRTIGRTMTLVCQNIGKSIPGVSEMRMMWNLLRNGYCIREDEENLPPSWEPFHVEKGFKKETSTVAVVDETKIFYPDEGAGRGSGVVEIDMRHFAKRFVEINFSPGMGIGVNSALILLMPATSAKNFADNGWTKQYIKEYLYENCRINPDNYLKDYPPDVREEVFKTYFSQVPAWMKKSESIPAVPRPEDQMIFVAGQGGIHVSPPTHHGQHPCVIKQIALADGTPAKSVKDFKRK